MSRATDFVMMNGERKKERERERVLFPRTKKNEEAKKIKNSNLHSSPSALPSREELFSAKVNSPESPLGYLGRCRSWPKRQFRGLSKYG